MQYLVVYNPRYDRYVEEFAPAPVPPEARLEVTLLAAPLFAIAFFWFGWTSYPSISLWSPLLAGGLLGFSIFMIFVSIWSYLPFRSTDAILVALPNQLYSRRISFRGSFCIGCQHCGAEYIWCCVSCTCIFHTSPGIVQVVAHPPLQLFARQMFEALNPRWASTVLGIVAAIMIPIPIVLQRYGPYLRSKSRFAPAAPPAKPQNSAV